MKNIIYIVIDAFSYKNLEMKVGKSEVTPFLNKLKKESISFEKMYSLAPYTEAAQISLLGKELPLESGGYLLGVEKCKKNLYEEYKKKYEIVSSYSPYINSKSYIRDVDEFYYTRLFSIEPLFLYRLSYYREKNKKGLLSDEELNICQLLLDEAFETWILQCNNILNCTKEVEIISKNIKSKFIVDEIKKELLIEYKDYYLNKKEYLFKLFYEFDSNYLREINKKYTKNIKKLPLEEFCKASYLKKLKEYQNKYLEIIKAEKVEMKYILSQILSNRKGIKEGVKDCIRLMKSIHNYKNNRYLEKYLTDLNEYSNVEASMKTIFDSFLSNIIKKDKENKRFFSFIHVQDFHLPSMFHTYDSSDRALIEEEFEKAFELLEELDDNYKGNIIASLSARYCDLKIENFFEEINKKLKNDYLFVVTSDHGYPSYYNPPRSMIYNQVYTEAFHIPLIIYSSKEKESYEEKNIYSSLDGIKFLEKYSGINDKEVQKKGYVLCEYGGPGCPAIYEKEIWYSLITKDISISLQCSFENNIDFDCVKTIYDLNKDPMQKYNLIKKAEYRNLIKKYLLIVNERHELLKKKYKKNFFKNY